MKRMPRYAQKSRKVVLLACVAIVAAVLLYVTVYPLVGMSLSAMGREAYREGQYKRAERLLSWSSRMGWLDRDVWGAAAYRLGKYEEIVRVLGSTQYHASSTRINPPAGIMSLLGLSQLQIGQKSAGLHSLRLASQEQPSVWIWHHNYAFGLALSGHHLEAVKERSIAESLDAPGDLDRYQPILSIYDLENRTSLIFGKTDRS